MAGLAVVLDTNVLLSGLAYPASVPGRLLATWRFGALEVVLSDFILAELVDPEVVEESDLTDRYDLPVLGTLLAALQLGLAQTLVTGDKALLTLRDRYPIRTPAEFWAVHGGL
jgi:predicted nucleic acid-binding protein